MPEASRPARILVVDDDPDILQLLGETLRNATDFPNETILEADPKAALERLAQSPVDLVITDYKMPDMDGVDLLLQVKNRYPKTIRVLMTAHSTKQAALAAILSAEVHSYLEKPFQPNEVLEVLRDALVQQAQPVEGLAGFVGPSDRALELVKDLCLRMENAPPEAHELALTLSFPTTSDFNHFANRAFRDQPGEVKDIRFEDGRFLVTVSCFPESNEPVGAAGISGGSTRRTRPIKR